MTSWRILFLSSSLLGCSPNAAPAELAPPSAQAQLMDPEACGSCHAQHYTEWSGSMHAYASDDPVFTAMNRRGQAETHGQLGTFCVNCHAPLAVQTGSTVDGLNLDSLPRRLRGVTCYFCHTVDSVDDAHDSNNPLHLAGDGVMRGEYRDPVPNVLHQATYSELHDRDKLASARLCGTCHDVTTTQQAHIERTFQEWQGSVFSQPAVGTTCGQCHMDQSKSLEPAAQNSPNVFDRRTHSHLFAAVDTALSPFAESETQRASVQAALDATLQSALCVQGIGQDARILVILDNVAAGHGFPSGSAQDRRLWAEVTAFAGENAVYQSGVVPPGTPVTDLRDPDLWLLRDCMFDAQRAQVNMFWNAASYDTNQLPAQLTFDKGDARYYQSHVYKTYPSGTSKLPAGVDKVRLRLRLEPTGLDVIGDLVASRDLDPAVAPAVVQVGPDLVWTPDTATETYLDQGLPTSCISATNLSASAERVPAKLGCVAPMPSEVTTDAGAGEPSNEPVSCANDTRVDTYAANLSKVSANGMRVVLIQADPEPPSKGVNSWTVLLSDKNGAPIDHATVTLTPFMPDHGHGTSVKPVITPQGGGKYLATPVYLFMPGVWRVTLSATFGGTSDSVTFFFCIEG